jgi:hypothetical protein
MSKKNCSLLIFIICINLGNFSFAQEQNGHNRGGLEREYLVNSLAKIGSPVLEALSQNKLKALMPVEASIEGREKVTYLEAFGRLISGMAPWLELGPDKTPEGTLRAKYISLARKSIHNATDPNSPDFMNFNKGGQPLVDAAFFAQGLLRAPTQLWEPLSKETKVNVIQALKSSRSITPFPSNWLLFSGIVEAALLRFTGEGDEMRMDYAINFHKEWYKGDGAYGDGNNFHWDYYNSFVIQPMLLDVLATRRDFGYTKNRMKREFDLAFTRAQRYAAVQERLISPEATYPPIGRSLAYRFGAFQALSQIALLHGLPDNVSPQQVRFALYSVIKKQIEAPGTFDEDGWLKIGLYGHQPGIGERYISTGSLYLCSEAYLFLGLPPNDPLWNGPDKDWTAKKVWEGQPLTLDHSIHN